MNKSTFHNFILNILTFLWDAYLWILNTLQYISSTAKHETSQDKSADLPTIFCYSSGVLEAIMDVTVSTFIVSEL